MPARSNHFQRLIRDIERIANGTAQVEESAMVPDSDGGLAEVDVLISVQVGQRTLRIAVECRDHSRPQSVNWIEQLAGKYEALLTIDRVVAVASNGFSKKARARAARTKIELLTLEQASQLQWLEQLGLVVTVNRRRLSIAGGMHFVGEMEDGGDPPAQFPMDVMQIEFGGRTRPLPEAMPRVVSRLFEEMQLRLSHEHTREPSGVLLPTSELNDPVLIFPDGRRMLAHEMAVPVRWRNVSTSAPFVAYRYGDASIGIAAVRGDGMEGHGIAAIDAAGALRLHLHVDLGDPA